MAGLGSVYIVIMLLQTVCLSSNYNKTENTNERALRDCWELKIIDLVNVHYSGFKLKVIDRIVQRHGFHKSKHQFYSNTDATFQLPQLLLLSGIPYLPTQDLFMAVKRTLEEKGLKKYVT